MQSFDVISTATTFTATFFGVLLAFGLTFGYDRWRKNRDEREEEINVLQTLRNELEDVEDTIKSLDPKRTYVRLILPKYAWDTAVNSGKLVIVGPSMQSILTEVYSEVESARWNSDRMMSLLGTTTNPTQLKVLQNSMNYLFFASELAKGISELSKTVPTTIRAIDDRLAYLDESKIGFLTWIYFSMARYFALALV